jgi:hypothetical protein
MRASDRCDTLAGVAGDALEVTRRQVLAFPAAGHGLALRRPHDERLDRAGPATPKGRHRPGPLIEEA